LTAFSFGLDNPDDPGLWFGVPDLANAQPGFQAPRLGNALFFLSGRVKPMYR